MSRCTWSTNTFQAAVVQLQASIELHGILALKMKDRCQSILAIVATLMGVKTVVRLMACNVMSFQMHHLFQILLYHSFINCNKVTDSNKHVCQGHL